MKVSFFVLQIGFIFFSNQSMAQENFFIDGKIEIEILEVLTSSQGIKRVFLNSTGGPVDASIEIAKWIRENKIETVVSENAVCMSACTLLFQAGVKRIAHETALFMYHGVQVPNLPASFIEGVKECVHRPDPGCLEFIRRNKSRLEEKTHQVFSLYILYGANEKIYEDYFSLGEDPNWIDNGNYIKIRDWYMDAAKAYSYNVATEISTSHCHSSELCY